MFSLMSIHCVTEPDWPMCQCAMARGPPLKLVWETPYLHVEKEAWFENSDVSVYILQKCSARFARKLHGIRVHNDNKQSFNN